MRLELSRRYAETSFDRDQWNSLVMDSPGATVFQTYEWFQSWWSAFGAGRELFLITVWDRAALAGIAPLMVRRRAGIRILEFIGSPNADYQDFILGRRSREILPHLAALLHTERHQWDMMVLRNVPTESPTFAAFPAMLRSLGLGATDFERVACPTLQIAERAPEVSRTVGGYGFRRSTRQLAKHGKVEFRRCTSSDEIERDLPLFFEQYAARHRGTPSARTFANPAARALYVSLAREMLPRGWLHFSVLTCGSKPAAFHFGFEFRDRLYWYKPCFDPLLSRASPGKVLLSHLIRDAMSRGLQELDFTVGAEPFKYRYSTSERTNANIRAFSRRWAYQAFGALASGRQFLARIRRRAKVAVVSQDSPAVPKPAAPRREM